MFFCVSILHFFVFFYCFFGCRVFFVFCSFWLLPSVSLRHPPCFFSPSCYFSLPSRLLLAIVFPFWWSCSRFLVIAALCLWCPSLWHFACVFILCVILSHWIALHFCDSWCCSWFFSLVFKCSAAVSLQVLLFFLNLVLCLMLLIFHPFSLVAGAPQHLMVLESIVTGVLL